MCLGLWGGGGGRVGPGLGSREKGAVNRHNDNDDTPDFLRPRHASNGKVQIRATYTQSFRVHFKVIEGGEPCGKHHK